jgi:anthranilate synthase component 1
MNRVLPLRKRIPADLDTPVSAFLKLQGCGASCLLESVERGIQLGRYSFIVVSSFAGFKLDKGFVRITRGNDTQTQELGKLDPLDLIRRELASTLPVAGEGLPGPFAGAVGYISYDAARFFERLPAPQERGLDLPDLDFIFPSTLVVFDHVQSEIEILALPVGSNAEVAHRRAEDEIERLLDALAKPVPAASAGRFSEAQAPAPAASGMRGPIEIIAKSATPREQRTFNMTESSFKEKVSTIKEHILAGDAFQIVLSHRLEGETSIPPFEIYRALRILNPSPYMFFMDFGDFQLIGSSPEMLVKLEGRNAVLCPIAGTRPRGKGVQEDKALEEELKANEKERAEHVMLVDLGRNDLGKVCEMGSIRTESFMSVEKYSHVMHLVSRITGTLRDDTDMFDLLRATFPAGTVTGAPKIRAMEIINELEPDRRGPYGGALGYFGRHGDMDMCIVIRTIIIKGGRYFIQGGAGIVADSDPAAEYLETLNKIKALSRAIAIAKEGS